MTVENSPLLAALGRRGLFNRLGLALLSQSRNFNIVIENARHVDLKVGAKNKERPEI